LRAQLLSAWDAGPRADLLQHQLALREHLLRLQERRRALGLVLLNLPFALVGGVVAVLLTGANLSLGSRRPPASPSS
jgi:hypothetical protein